MNIIAVDDELDALQALERAIKKAEASAQLTCFDSAKEALLYAKNHSIDAAFLDIEMNEIDGVTLAKHLQSIRKQTNIIFVTGFGEYMEAALDLRVSGYVFKPINPARVREELNNLRYEIEDDAQVKLAQELGPYTFDHLKGRVYCDGQDTLLKPKEFNLFCVFANNPGIFFTPEDLYKKVWGDEPVGNIDTVKMHVSRLRAKLGMTEESSVEIKSQRGKGYYLEWTP